MIEFGPGSQLNASFSFASSCASVCISSVSGRASLVLVASSGLPIVWMLLNVVVVEVFAQKFLHQVVVGPVFQFQRVLKRKIKKKSNLANSKTHNVL